MIRRTTRRKTLAALAGLAATAGCSGFTDSSASRAGNGAWPTNTTDSSPDPSTREWSGGFKNTQMSASKLVLEDVTVEILQANAALQLGVSTANAERQNSEDIPKSKFQWYEASDNSFFWFVYVNFIAPDEGELQVPDADNWLARPMLGDETTAVRPFTSSFDPDPTYFRQPSNDGQEYTVPAYSNVQEGTALQAMVFEIEAESIELLYGQPPEATWFFKIK